MLSPFPTRTLLILVSSSSPSQGREGKNECVVHSGNCRPLCGLCILALFKFRVVCSGSHKSSIRWLFRASKAHAGPGGSTAHSLPLAPAKLCLQMTSSPASLILRLSCFWAPGSPTLLSSQQALRSSLLRSAHILIDSPAFAEDPWLSPTFLPGNEADLGSKP